MKKIKNYWLNLIKNNYKGIIFLLIFILFCYYDTGYSIYKPGGTILVDERISGENLSDPDGSFNLAYVGYMKGKLPFYLLAKIIPDWTLVSNEHLSLDGEDINDTLIRDHLEYENAISNAIYVAFTYHHDSFKITQTYHYLNYKTDQNTSDLKVGDEIISYDDIDFTTTDKLITYINNQSKGDTIKIKYIRNDEEKETTSQVYQEDEKLYLGLSVISINEYESKYNLKIKSKASESGPSGGLTTALAIYNLITDEDITKGKKIVGTGTIDINGNVGEIGGVDYKLAAAVKDDAEVFICPNENYDEANNLKKEKNYNITIIGVQSFAEAIKFLEEIS